MNLYKYITLTEMQMQELIFFNWKKSKRLLKLLAKKLLALISQSLSMNKLMFSLDFFPNLISRKIVSVHTPVTSLQLSSLRGARVARDVAIQD